MGPMMNLALMRQEGIWETLLAAHEAIGQDEQLSLTAACGGRTKGVGKQWNVVPQWDHLEKVEAPRSGHAVIAGIPWRNGVPEGIIHWTGPSKPWHRGTRVWRADLWESERTTWEHLKAGIWEKPVAVEIEPEQAPLVRALARRGWRIEVLGERFAEPENRRLDAKDEPHPDVIIGNGGPARLETVMAQSGPRVEVVRFASGTRPAEWLQPLSSRPAYLALKGPVDAIEVRHLRKLGYRRETRIRPGEWPGGGPAPRVLDFLENPPVLAVSSDEELYLHIGGAEVDIEMADASCEAETGSPVTAIEEEWPWQISAASEEVLRRLGSECPAGMTIQELGTGHGTPVLAEHFPGARITSLEHHAGWHAKCLARFGKLPGVKLRHAPLDGTLPWYDCREIDFEPVDLLFIAGPEGAMAKSVRAGAPALRRYVKEGGRVVLDGMDEAEKRTVLPRWLSEGHLGVVEDQPGCVVMEMKATEPPLLDAHAPACDESLAGLAEKVYVISLPEREDRREQLRQNWQTVGLEFDVIEGVRPEESDIRWEEMKGMEAYGKAEHLRGSYIPGAVGCKRAGIKALKTFLESGAKTALICQDDCLWKPDAVRTVSRALQELPLGWDLLYFSASSRDKNHPHSPHLVRLGGARFRNAILWTRATAMRLLPELERCDCEWDLFMQRSHSWLRAYCVVPMPAYQGKSKSDIVLGVVQPPNR
jgi:hypothetical protein